jgi:hypothetical protein
MAFNDLTVQHVNSKLGTEFTIISRHNDFNVECLEWSDFEISVSAYDIMLVKANVSSEKEINILMEALKLAKKLHAEEQQHHDAE